MVVDPAGACPAGFGCLDRVNFRFGARPSGLPVLLSSIPLVHSRDVLSPRQGYFPIFSARIRVIFLHGQINIPYERRTI